MKTIICLISSILISTSAIAHENSDRIGKCFVVDGENITKGCIVSSGGVAGGMYTLLTIGEKEFLIEELTMNPDSEERSIAMGGDSDELLEAKEYYRDKKTKKELTAYKEDAWLCYKQVNGKMDACYRTR